MNIVGAIVGWITEHQTFCIAILGFAIFFYYHIQFSLQRDSDISSAAYCLNCIYDQIKAQNELATAIAKTLEELKSTKDCSTAAKIIERLDRIERKIS